MTPEQFRAIRQALGLTLDQWGEALGYSGANRRQMMHNLESGARPITPMCARLAEMFRRHGVPPEWTASPQ